MIDSFPRCPQMDAYSRGAEMILPPDIPYLATEAERLARATCGHLRTCRDELADISSHESRFAAARWLESIGRPGWRFLDGPGPLTPEQSARALHEACLRARDGSQAIVGVVGAWNAGNRAVIAKPPEMPDWVISFGRWEGTPTDEQMAAVGWFCL